MELSLWVVLLLAAGAAACWVMFFRKAPKGGGAAAATPPAKTPQPDIAAGVTPEDLATPVEAEPAKAEPEPESEPAPGPERTPVAAPEPKPKRTSKAKPKPQPETEPAPELPFETRPPAEPAKPLAVEPAAPERAPEPTPGQPKLYDAPSDGPRDNLSALNGVGPALQSRLNRLGVYYFRQIAAWSEDEAAWVDEEIRGQGRILREDWPGQARKLIEDQA